MKLLCSTLLFCLSLTMIASEKTGFYNGTIDSQQQLILGAEGTIFIKDTNGQTVQNIKVGGAIHDLSFLKNGHILFANGNCVKEIDLDGKGYFEYIPANNEGGGVYAAERLENGETVISENSTGRILFLDTKGKIIREIKTVDFTPKDHHNLRLARHLKNGNVLVCHSGRNMVREYAPDGKIIWSKKTPKTAFKAIRLENGNTMISELDAITEYTPSGEIAWQVKCSDFPLFFIRNLTGFELLPNDQILIGSYYPHEKDKPGQSAILIDKKTKKVLWRYSQPKELATVMALQLIKKKK